MTSHFDGKLYYAILCHWNLMKRVMNLITGGFPSQGPVARSVDVFVDRRLDKRLSERSRRRRLKTPSLSLWHHKVDEKYRQLSKVVSTYILNLTHLRFCQSLSLHDLVPLWSLVKRVMNVQYIHIWELSRWCIDCPVLAWPKLSDHISFMVHGICFIWIELNLTDVITAGKCSKFRGIVKRFFIIFYSFHKLIQRQPHLLVCKLSYSKGK